MNVFLWNTRARNGHVEATLNHPFPAQVAELRDAYERTGGVSDYFLDFKNAVDLSGYAVQLALVPAWVNVNVACLKLAPAVTYDTHDVMATGRVTEAREGTGPMLAFFDDLDEVERLFGIYDSVCTLGIIALSAQLLKNVQFHPTFGMISRTIVSVGGILWFWLCMLVMMLALYTFIGTLLLGQHVPDFADIPTTAVTLLAAMSDLYDRAGKG